MRRNWVIFISLFFNSMVYGQAPFLKPSIGIASLPADTQSICPLPLYLGSFDTSGYMPGDTIPDFTLYTSAGVPVNLHNVLQSSKPVLLVAGSYTCPEFRARVADLNNMTVYYQGLLDVYVVYTLEAHPDDTISVYTGTYDIGPQNIMDNILYPQATRYGERRSMVDTLNQHLAVLPTILVDGPCNEWWSNYGPAPDNAYLIDTNGVVFAKNPWFNNEPESMWCSIDSLLGTHSGHCNVPVAGGTFDFHLQQDSVVTGIAGSTLEVHAMLRNLSSTTAVNIHIEKTQPALPVAWQTAICTNICLPPQVDTTYLSIQPSDSQDFIMYFYTDSIPNTGSIGISFSNYFDTANVVSQRFYAITNALASNNVIAQQEEVIAYPNPATEKLNIIFPSSNDAHITLASINGAVINERSCTHCHATGMDVSALPQGMYMLKVRTDSSIINKKIIIR